MTESPTRPSGDEHLASLDAVRGLAALAVAIAHAFMALKLAGVDRLWEVALWHLTPWQAVAGRCVLMLANPGLAVTVFFVLSGLVLGLSLDRAGPFSWRGYATFLVRRALRIYPAHVTVILSVTAALFLSQAHATALTDPMSGWYVRYYRAGVDVWNLWPNLCLLSTNLNPVTWTLQVEVMVAILFPFLHALARWKPDQAAWQGGLALGLLGLGLMQPHSFWLPWLFAFQLGLLIPVVVTRWPAHVRWHGAACWLVLPLALLVPQWCDWARLNQLLLVLTAFLLVSGALRARHESWWNNILTRALGRWSYGFYLWHFPVLWFGYFALWRNHWLPDPAGMGSGWLVLAGCLTSIGVTLPLAWFSHRWIERPAMSLGRRLAGHSPTVR